MSHFAKIKGGIVTQVIVAEQNVIDSGIFGDPASFKKCSYNTRGGVHYGTDGKPDGVTALRGNYAGVGDTYDAANDVFYTPQPFPSWTIGAPSWLWQPPVAYPSDGKDYAWNESAQSWRLP